MNAPESVRAILVEGKIPYNEVPDSFPLTIAVDPAHLHAMVTYLHQHPGVYFDHLTNITGIDNGPSANTMEVIYHLYSIPFHYSLALKVVLSRESPEVESLTGIWKSANWLEREVFDMFGIRFKNHPDLRRILMPHDWQGFPLRKDYQQQEMYHEVKVAY
ncbi:MAG: NADH-quinone oxidoreductase subunit C [Bacteroidota bacterium]